MAVKRAADAVKKTEGPSRIAKEDGRPAVEAWLDHVTPEHRTLVHRIDALILETVPDAVCAVKFRKPTNKWGRPVPPLAAPPRARAIDVHSDEEFDERQIKAWLQQAKQLPGWGGF